MNMTELDHALRKLRLSGIADTLEIRLLEAQSEKMAPIDLVAALVRVPRDREHSFRSNVNTHSARS